jgi:superoxide dismutase, Fe-Mn family
MITKPKLPYPENGLEPVISAETISFHYGKHHQAYVDNLNKLIEGTAFENKSLEEIVVASEGGIFNNAAQVWNHTFYWNCLKPGGSEPHGKLLEAIERDFGSFEQFKEEFSKASVTLFGSGWAWLVKDKDGKLSITQESNAGTPLTKGLQPIITFDVWEHAYYLDKQNKRPEYVLQLWSILNWDFALENFIK